jgi:hypothetical protein
MRSTRVLVGLAAGLLVVAAFVAASTALAHQPVAVSLDAPSYVQPGDAFSVRVIVSGVVNFDAGQFDVTFDPDVLTIDDISPGAGIADGSLDGTPVPVVLVNELSPGVVRVILNVPDIPGVSGSGFLSELRFRAIGADGTASVIGLTDVLLGDNTAAEIPSVFQGPVTVRIGDRPAAPTSPVATPTALPTQSSGALPGARSLEVGPVTASIPAGDTLQFTATLSDGTALDAAGGAMWASSDTLVATIDASGLATAIREGQVTISASFGETIGSATLTVTVGLGSRSGPGYAQWVIVVAAGAAALALMWRVRRRYKRE